MRQSNFLIKYQGEPVVYSVHVFRRRKDVVLLCIDMKQRCCIVSATSVGDGGYLPGLYIEVSGSREKSTLVILTDFAGWDLFSVSDAGKYNIRLTLIKNDTK